ncbi:reverse transcriptase domain-containing protein [Tanacetum coccineum]
MPANFLVEIPSEDNEKKEKPKKVPDSSSKEYTYTLRFEFETINNEAEYEALLAEDTREARKIRIQAPQYKLIRGNLYKRSFFTSWLCYVAPPQTNKIIKETHEGSCGFNTEPRSLAVKITKQGFYWPSMHREVVKAIQDCKKCKEQSVIRKAGTSGAVAAGSTWPFSHWGIHII